MLPLLYRGVQALSSDTVSQPIRAALEYYFHANAQRNLFLGETLLRLLRVLTTHDILAML